ncbi:MAG: arginine--tRNA ligase [marine bacterium B5-7]|nr:MAG: arginine--tRNA ligase [marine bacterium B5-7]
MKSKVQSLVATALSSLVESGRLPAGVDTAVHIERTRQPSHGDYATNVALTLSRQAEMKPRDLASMIAEQLPPSELVEKVEIAGPGFINLFIRHDAYGALLKSIRAEGAKYGESQAVDLPRVMVEFVSANPTGPLHVGHGRGAAYGDSLVRVLRKAGYTVASEYYFNDAGRQMNILAVSVWLRYLELCGEAFDFPDNAYKGDYIFDIAATCHRQNSEQFRVAAERVFEDLPQDPEARIDMIIARAHSILGEDNYRIVFNTGLDTLVDDIRNDLAQFRVEFDCWFSERSLVENGAIDRALQTLREKGLLFESEGALWFESTRFGDEKDRVVRRANGAYTYFASDIAYCHNKKERGFDTLIYVWGADHHGYVKRTRAAFEALGNDPDEFAVLLVQFAVLYRGGEKVSMSTRSGDFVTLRELRNEVGNDAARFFYALRKPDQHMDFDLDLAKSKTNENPVYYVQYAHARVKSVFRQMVEKGIPYHLEDADITLLIEHNELDLMRDLSRFPEVVESAAKSFEPHQVAYYLRELAQSFHAYYNAHPFIASEPAMRDARLVLIDAARQVFANGLDLLGVSAPDAM